MTCDARTRTTEVACGRPRCLAGQAAQQIDAALTGPSRAASLSFIRWHKRGGYLLRARLLEPIASKDPATTLIPTNCPSWPDASRKLDPETLLLTLPLNALVTALPVVKPFGAAGTLADAW